MINKTLIHNAEQQLISQCVHRDRRAQKQLYQLYAKRMYNVAYRILNDRGLAEDAIQEGFLAVFNGLSKFNQESSLETWMRRIMVNKAVQLLKKETRLKFSSEEVEVMDEDEEIESTAWSVEDIKKGIRSMPLGYQTVVNLYLIEGFDHQEISQILKISVSTSKSQYHRGRKLLQKYLKPLI